MSVRFTMSDIKAKLKAGTIQGYTDTTPAARKKKPDAVKRTAAQDVLTELLEPKGIKHIKKVLEGARINYVRELQFAKPDRKFRFDFAIIDIKVAIEYEGLVATGKKGGHQTKSHYTKDCTKYNLAASLGWKVLRYTNLNYQEFTITEI